jgi:hypothetical protein
MSEICGYNFFKPLIVFIPFRHVVLAACEDTKCSGERREGGEGVS